MAVSVMLFLTVVSTGLSQQVQGPREHTNSLNPIRAGDKSIYRKNNLQLEKDTMRENDVYTMHEVS